MPNRITKVYTRSGDDGLTGLGDGTRIAKTDARIEAMGAVDELNSLIGVVVATAAHERCIGVLTRIQNELFDLGAELCLPGQTRIQAARVEAIEQDIDALNSALPALKEFILPGGSLAAAHCHQARAVCRRAERRVLALEAGNPQTVHYLNRLSDLLFVIARSLARHKGGQEILWQP